MPKILGLNSLAVLLATLAFYFVGFLWYGLFFMEAWMNAAGITEADYGDQSQGVWMLGGVLITIMQVIGIGLVLRWKGAASIGDAVKTTLIIWALFALPFVHYNYLYEPDHSVVLLIIDASHLLVGWVISAVILSLIK